MQDLGTPDNPCEIEDNAKVTMVNGDDHCPFCGTTNIAQGLIRNRLSKVTSPQQAYIRWYCSDCKHSWVMFYRLNPFYWIPSPNPQTR